MKRFTLFLTAMLFALFSFSQTVILSDQDLQKLQMLEDAKLEKKMMDEGAIESSPRFLQGFPGYTKAIVCPEDASYSNPPLNFETGVTSNSDAGYEAAQKFEDLEGAIQSIRFFGIQAINPGTGWQPMNDVDPYVFEIKFYEDNGGLPGTLISTHNATLNHVNTGETFAGAYNVYHWDFLPDSPIDGLPATFWLGVSNSNTNAWFLWIDQPGGPGATAQADGGVWALTESNSFGYCIVTVLAEDDAPALVDDLEAIPGADGALEATLSWTNPSTQFDGEPLTELTEVNVYRDGELIHTIEAPTIGGAETYTDNDIAEPGNYAYSVQGVNDAGEGPAASVSIYVGEDVPAAPGNVVLAAQDNDGFLTWEAPTTGLNNGFFDPASLVEYSITRNPDGATFTVAATETEFLDETVPGIGFYSYTVAAVNNVGTGGAATSNTVLLAAEGAVFMGNGEVTTCEGTFFDSGGPEGEYQNNENYVLTFYPETEGAKMQFQFTAFNVEQGWDFLYVYMGEEVDEANLVGQFSGTSVPAPLVNLISTDPTGAITFRFTSDGSVTRPGWEATIGCFIPADLDLDGISISGNITPSVGMESTYSVTILNRGSQALNAGDYTVEIRDMADNVLASAPGVDINPDQTLTVPVAWTPDTEGPLTIMGYANLPGDGNPDNNSTPGIDIMVQPADIIAVTIGDGEVLTTQPYNMVWHYSIQQTLYYPEEIGLGGGVITGIQYVNSFGTAYMDRDIMIWMGETDMENLSDGWVDPSTLQLVFDGRVDFPEGINEILIPLDEPYVYGGGNLVIYNYKMDDDWTFDQNFFNTLDEGSNRTRRWEQDNNPFDPVNPPAGSTSSHFPNITMFMTTEGLGALEGTVTDGTDPLEGVLVRVLGTSSTRVTDENGFYEFPALIADTYNVEFSKFGYETVVEEAVVVEADVVTELNVVVPSLDQFTVSGTVIGNDGVLQQGAVLTLEGYDDYTATTNADGEFTIDEVYSGSYVMTVVASGYEVFVDEAFMVDADISDLEITVIETIVPPFALMVDTVGYGPGEAMLSWNEHLGEELFEGFEGDFPPAGWSKLNPDGGTGWMQLASGTSPLPGWVGGEAIPAPDGGNFMAYASWQQGGASSNDQYLITPEIVVADGFEFSFYLRYWPDEYDDNVDIRISTTTNDNAAAFDILVETLTFTVGSSMDWELYTYNLTDYVSAGETVYIAFREYVADNFNDGAAIMIDNVYYGPETKRAIPQPMAMKGIHEIVDRDFNYVSSPKAEKAFIGFNVFLNDVEVASEITQTQHMFTGLPGGTHVAGVQSVYTTGVSEIVTIEFDVEGPSFARAQIIHNSADAAVANVDLYVNGELALEDVAFRQATPFIDIVAGVTIELHVAPAGAGIENAVGPIEVMFTPGETYVVVANGIVSDTGYDPLVPFSLSVYDQGQEEAGNAAETDVLVFHGSTDAPEVSVWAEGITNALIPSIVYGEFASTGYLPLPTADYILQIRDAAGETTIVAFEAPLGSLGLEGEALVVVASGFLNPANNSDGPGFGLWAAGSDGGDLTELPLYVSVQDITMGSGNISMFPNPSNHLVNLHSESTMKEVRVIDISGRMVYSGTIESDQHQINVRQFESGIYFVQVLTAEGLFTGKLQIHK